MSDKHEGASAWLGMVFFAILVFGAIFSIWEGYREDRLAWESWRDSHHCVAIGIKESAGRSPEQTIYRCDNGEMRIH